MEKFKRPAEALRVLQGFKAYINSLEITDTQFKTANEYCSALKKVKHLIKINKVNNYRTKVCSYDVLKRITNLVKISERILNIDLSEFQVCKGASFLKRINRHFLHIPEVKSNKLFYKLLKIKND